MEKTEILAIIERETGKTADESTELDDLGADSLEMMSLFTALDIPDAVFADMQTVGDVVRYVERH
jgi:acyl carrier protein